VALIAEQQAGQNLEDTTAAFVVGVEWRLEEVEGQVVASYLELHTDTVLAEWVLMRLIQQDHRARSSVALAAESRLLPSPSPPTHER